MGNKNSKKSPDIGKSVLDVNYDPDWVKKQKRDTDTEFMKKRAELNLNALAGASDYVVLNAWNKMSELDKSSLISRDSSFTQRLEMARKGQEALIAKTEKANEPALVEQAKKILDIQNQNKVGGESTNMLVVLGAGSVMIVGVIWALS